VAEGKPFVCEVAGAVATRREVFGLIGASESKAPRLITRARATASPVADAWEGIKLRPGQILGPSVIAHATDLVEHPELVAERIMNYANIVGRENVQTNTDCGIGSRVGHEEIVWAKLKAVAEGARLASKELWS
jgi:methionine synthase II (cobalamin-independent)